MRVGNRYEKKNQKEPRCYGPYTIYTLYIARDSVNIVWHAELQRCSDIQSYLRDAYAQKTLFDKRKCDVILHTFRI